jgi:hypothetical protein
MKIYFDHEKLDVYQEAIAFCGWVGEFLAGISAKAAAKDQLDRAVDQHSAEYFRRKRKVFSEGLSALSGDGARLGLGMRRLPRCIVSAKACHRAASRTTKRETRPESFKCLWAC